MSPSRPSPCRRTRRPVVLGALVALVGLLAAGYLAVAGLRPLPVPAGWPPQSGLAEYSAVLHVHSRYSHDGSGTIEEIAAAAARAGVEIVFLTDHNTLAPLQEGKERWYGSALVLVGAEIPTGSGYLLLLDPQPHLPVRARGFGLPDLVSRYRAAGAIVLMAHPEHPRLGWRNEVPPIDGIEVIDVFDQLVGAPVHRQLMALLAYPANPVRAILSLVHWPRGVLQRWDRMARGAPMIGVLGLDAHGGVKFTEETGLRFPAHETAFRLGRMHFVTREPLRHDAGDRGRVYGAMRAGHFANAFDGLAPARGFRFHARRGDRTWLMGESVAFRDELVLEAEVPPVGETAVRLVRDGAVVVETPGSTRMRFAVREPGLYRVEVDLQIPLFPITAARRMPWIFSNHIRVTP